MGSWIEGWIDDGVLEESTLPTDRLAPDTGVVAIGAVSGAEVTIGRTGTGTGAVVEAGIAAAELTGFVVLAVGATAIGTKPVVVVAALRPTAGLLMGRFEFDASAGRDGCIWAVGTELAAGTGVGAATGTGVGVGTGCDAVRAEACGGD